MKMVNGFFSADDLSHTVFISQLAFSTYDKFSPLAILCCEVHKFLYFSATCYKHHHFTRVNKSKKETKANHSIKAH